MPKRKLLFALFIFEGVLYCHPPRNLSYAGHLSSTVIYIAPQFWFTHPFDL